MVKHLLVIFISVFFLLACSNKVQENKPEEINGQVLHLLVEEALRGSEDANRQLSGPVNPNTPPPENYNQLTIDSIVTQSGEKLYSVIIEYSNPLYNILAVYNKDLTLYLQDNSLNGNIVTRWEKFSNKNYLVASENFISKDILKLSRISLYTLIDEKFYLVFRSFTKFDKTGKVYLQTLESINDNKIIARITTDRKSRLNNLTDTFSYNNSKHKFISPEDIFSKFVIDEIKNANWEIEKPELKLETLERKDKELKSDSPPESEEIAIDMKGYQISLGSDWKDAVSIGLTEHLISKLEGIRYINEKLGAQITVIPMPEGSSASQFVKYKFGKSTSGDYRVRSTALIESENNYIRFYEHSCGIKSYLLLLQAPKYTFEKNKQSYESIATSFFIEC